MPYGLAAPARLGATALSDGRQLGWAEWGPETGVPVLLCPGAATSRRLGFGGDLVDRLGVRLISVDRPGLGSSDPAPGRGLLDWAADVAALVEQRELPSLRVVGYSQGAPFALACAAAGFAERAAVVAGTDELSHPGLSSLLAPDVDRLVKLAKSDPATAETSFADFGSADGLWEMVIGMSSAADRKVFTSPAFAEAFRQALAEGFTQGSAGYARDTLLTMSPWPFDPGRICIPVDLWYGELDGSPVHSPDFGKTLAQRLPQAHRHLLPEAGSALLWTHAAPILQGLVEPMATPS